MVPLQSSSLPADILSQIWDLADVDRDGELNAAEFIVAFVLVARILNNHPVPPPPPPPLLDVALAGAAPTILGGRLKVRDIPTPQPFAGVMSEVNAAPDTAPLWKWLFVAAAVLIPDRKSVV